MWPLIAIIIMLSSVSSDQFLDEIRSHPFWPKKFEAICGESYSDRIIGGKNAELGQYPWIAHIEFDVGGTAAYACGGSLVTDQHVITAAHCVYMQTVLRVTLGDWNVETDPDCDGNICAAPAQHFYPEQVVYISSFDPDILTNDIAGIKLDRKVTLTDWVSPICLPFGNVDDVVYNVGEMVELAGWGLNTNTNLGTPAILQSLTEPIAHEERCYAGWKKHGFSSLKQICAGGRDGIDSCGGDSGGPMMKVISSPIGVKYFLIGLVSYGTTRCAIGEPAVYTRVSAYSRFILNFLSK